MPHYATLLFISVFAIFAVLHIFFQYKIAQCRRPKNQAFYSSWLTDGWPYAVAYGLIKCVLPQLLRWVGFGALGILPRTIAAWIQSVYGVSRIFSLLQSIGARGGVSNPLFKSFWLLGSAIQKMKNWFWGDDYVAQCIDYYEWKLTILNMMDLAFVIYAFYWFFIRRK